MLIENGISWSTRFTNSILINNKLWPNDYDIRITFTPETNDMQMQNFVYDKYKCIFNKFLQNSIFIENNQEVFDKMDVFKNDVVDFVSAPYDQMAGVNIMRKLNSVGGDNLRVISCEIESWQGENLRYTITEDSPEWEILDDLQKEIKNPWWLSDQPVMSSFLEKQLTWEEIGFTIKDESRLKVIQGGSK